MGLIKSIRILLAALFLIGGGILYAQTAVPGQLGTEIQTIEQRLSSNISPAERHDALVRLAQLRQLSGNIAVAAAHWLDAVAADPYDEAALVSGAYCLAAIGEWEQAALTIQGLLASKPDIRSGGPAMLQARYLDAYLRALISSNATASGDASALASLAENSEFTALRPMIYYTLWQFTNRNPGMSGASGAEVWKTRLLAEFPKSPEARAVDSHNQNDSLSISAVQSPLWLLLPGAATPTPAPPQAAPVIVSAPTTPKSAEPTQPAVSIKPVESASPAAIPTPSPPPAVNHPPASTVILQTGLFSKEANAQTQSESLRRAGFNASIIRKLVNGTEYWAVTVNSNQSESAAIADLKKAGFDSFPVK